MITAIKNTIRSVLVKVPFRVTTNTWYDHCTDRIFKEWLTSTSNTVDVGCHKGEVLDLMIASSPNGIHFGFEPIPHLYKALKEKYHSDKIHILPYALAETEGTSSFNFVKSNPAYSGLIKRSYDHENVEDETIEVTTKRLDSCIDSTIKIDLIKIDVEGGEYGVLAGSGRILKNDKPLIVFEHGMGASEHYGTTPTDVYELLDSYGYDIFLLEQYMKKRARLTKSDFEKQFYQKLNYYFVASNRNMDKSINK